MQTQPSVSRHVVLISLFGLLLSAPDSGFANPHPQTVETKDAVVSLEGLDLATDRGVSQARQRVAAAVRRLCQSFSDSRRADDSQQMIYCYRETLAVAMQRLDARVAEQRSKQSDLARMTP
jgi:UrcA family protein